MSDYGLATFDAAGNPLITVDEKINRIAYIHEATDTESDSAVVNSIDGLLTVQMAFTINNTQVTQGAHEVTRSGTTISWASAPAPYTKMASLIMVFIYV
jgi:VCBS repeat-containing protein